jgi:hypothetical protein
MCFMCFMCFVCFTYLAILGNRLSTSRCCSGKGGTWDPNRLDSTNSTLRANSFFNNERPTTCVGVALVPNR